MKSLNIKPVLFTSKTYENGKHPILIRLTYGSKVKYLSTKDAVSDVNWNKNDNNVFEKKPILTERQKRTLNEVKLLELKKAYSEAIVLPDAKSINQRIYNKLQLINDVIKKLEVAKLEVNLKNIFDEIDRADESKSDKTIGFIRYAEGILKELEPTKYRTYKNYKTAIEKLKSFLKSQKRRSEIEFEEWDAEFIQKYEAYLKSMGRKDNTIWSDMKILKALTNKAISRKFINPNLNPFTGKTIKYQRTAKTRLSNNEIEKIVGLVLEKGTTLWHCRNYFMFAYYCGGMRFGDLCLLKWINFADGRLNYFMDKTGRFKSVKLTAKALVILEYYKTATCKDDDFIFPHLNNNYDYSDNKTLSNHISSRTVIQNSNLKKIAKQAEIKQVLSTKVSRHSFANNARKSGAGMYDICKTLGHSKLAITEAYLADFDLEAEDKLIDTMFDI